MAGNFASRKAKILQQLNVPDDEYSDSSPKGSVDHNITQLVAELNALDGYITTSSCGGRISVYLEGPAKPPKGSTTEINAPALPNGGKGGGEWLYSSHDPVEIPDAPRDVGSVYSKLGLPQDAKLQCPSDEDVLRFIHLKFEPMILHILTSSVDNAQNALTAAMEAGFRESGINGVGTPSRQKGPATPMVAVRTTGMSFDNIIGYMSSKGEIHPMVSEEYLAAVVNIANGRFQTNEQRKERFRTTLLARVASKDAVNANTRKSQPPRPARDTKVHSELRVHLPEPSSGDEMMDLGHILSPSGFTASGES